MHTNVRLWVKATCGPSAKLTNLLMCNSLQHDVDGQIRIMGVLALIKKRMGFLFLIDKNTCEMRF